MVQRCNNRLTTAKELIEKNIKEGNIVTYKSADDLREESGKSIDALFREIFHTDVYRGGDEAC